jgi:apolipoprotein N-acyltransferase
MLIQRSIVCKEEAFISRRLARLVGWRRYLLAFVLGVIAAGALPPVDAVPLLFLTFPGLVWLTLGGASGGSAFALGWSFGMGFFLAGIYWITPALLIFDIDRSWWVVRIAVAAGFAACLATFSGAALWLSHEICRRLHLDGVPRILVLASSWSGAEWLRGHLFTGFPWSLVGYAWSGAFPGALAVLQTAAICGIYGLSLLTVLAAMLPATLGDPDLRRWRPSIAALLLVAAAGLGGALRLSAGTTPQQPGVRLRLVQPSIPVKLKDDPTLNRRLFDLSLAPGSEKLTAVIWPEDAATPFILRRESFAMKLGMLAQVAPKGGYLITGTDRTDPLPAPIPHFWVSLAVIDTSGALRATYDSSHLVPFGEYVPLRDYLPIKMIALGSTDFSEGPGPRTLAIPGLPAFSPLICYEAVFPGAVTDPAVRPQWLLNVSNDAWFGFTTGPFQHFAVVRTRSVEEGLPLVRSANNGISGVVDPYGRVLSRLDLDAVGVLDVALPEPLPPTLYARFGDWTYLALLLTVLAWGFSGRASGYRPQNLVPPVQRSAQRSQSQDRSAPTRP